MLSGRGNAYHSSLFREYSIEMGNLFDSGSYDHKILSFLYFGDVQCQKNELLG